MNCQDLSFRVFYNFSLNFSSEKKFFFLNKKVKKNCWQVVLRELLLWWTQVITKLKLWKAQIATTQIVFKIQIVTKLSIKQHLNNEPSNFKQIPKNLKLQNTWPSKDGNIDTRLLGPDDGLAIQLPGGQIWKKTARDRLTTRWEFLLGGPDKARHLAVLYKTIVVVSLRWYNCYLENIYIKNVYQSVQCHLRCDCGNTKLSLLKCL